MKRNFKFILAAAVIILIAASSAGAQSVWSGNAAVGLPSDFTAVSPMPQAASNTFPAGTVLEVINPGTGLSVEVEVTGRVTSPGVFILIDTDAALSIGLPADLVVPVRVSPKSLGSVEQLTSGLNGDAAFTSDIDYNPAAVFADSSDIPSDDPIIAEEPPVVPIIPEESPREPAVPQELEDEPVIPEESSEEPAVPEEPPAVPIILEEPSEEPLIPAAPEPAPEPPETPETPEPLPDAVLVSSESFASSMPPDSPETLEHMGGKEKKSPAAPKFTASPPADEPPPSPAAPAVPEEPPASVREEAVPPPPPAEPNFAPPESIIAFNLAEAEAEEPPIEKTIIEEPDTEEPDIEELIIKEPEIEEPEIEDVIPETAPVQEPSDTITEAAPLPPPADEESERTVYFLTPSDLRPPESPESPPLPPEPPAPPAEPDTAAPPDEPAVLEDDASDEPLEIPLTAMQRLTPPDSRPYVQIGAYRDPALLSQAALEFTHQAPGYPLSYAADTDESGAVYRLLIGPLQPAERGVVLKTARSSIFPDAFPYTP